MEPTVLPNISGVLENGFISEYDPLGCSLVPVAMDICESSGGEIQPLYAVKDHQEGNDKIWFYCETCKKAQILEILVNAKLAETYITNPDKANDPDFVGTVRSEMKASI